MKRLGSLILSLIMLINFTPSVFADNANSINDREVQNLNLQKNDVQLPKVSLWDVKIGQDEGRPLVQKDTIDNKGDFGFKKNILNYNLYLRSTDAKAIHIYVKTYDTDENITILAEGNEYIGYRDINKNYSFLPIKIDVVTGGKYEIKVEHKGQFETYNINVILNDLEQDPQIFGNVKAYAGSDIAILSFVAKKIEFHTLTITVDIDNFDIIGGFVDEDLNYLGEGELGEYIIIPDTDIYNINPDVYEINPDVNPDSIQNINFLNLNKNLMVTKLMSGNNGSFIHFVLEKRTEAGKPNNGDPFIANLETPLISFRMQQTENAENTEQMTAALKIRANNSSADFNSAVAQRYKTLIDTDLGEHEEMSFISLRLTNPETLKMVLNHDSANDRIKFEVYNQENGELITPNIRNVDGVNLRYELFEGIFFIRITGAGYKTLNYRGIINDGTPTRNGIKIAPIDMLEGDINNDNVIDLVDRARLIEVFGNNALPDGSFNETFADYNNDGKINSLDLGRLIGNMGLDYLPNQTQYMPKNE